MKVYILKKLLEEESINIANKEEFEEIINLNDENSNYLLNLNKNNRRVFIDIVMLLKGLNVRDNILDLIRKIDIEELSTVALPIICYLIERAYIHTNFSESKLLLTIELISNIKDREKLKGLETLLNDIYFLNLSERTHKIALSSYSSILDNELIPIFTNIILDETLLKRNLTRYVSLELEKVKDPRLYKVICEMISDEGIKVHESYFIYALELAVSITNIDVLYPLSSILINSDLLETKNYKTIIDTLLDVEEEKLPFILNAYNEIIYNADLPNNYFLPVAKILKEVNLNNIWDFLSLVKNSDLYGSNYYEFTLNEFTKVKNIKICNDFVRLACYEDFLNNNYYSSILSFAKNIESKEVFYTFESMINDSNLTDSDHYLYTLEKISNIKMPNIVNYIKDALTDLYFLDLPDYRILVTKILSITDPNKIAIISNYIVSNEKISDKVVLSKIINKSLQIKETLILENYFKIIESTNFIESEYNNQILNIISNLKDPTVVENITNFIDTIEKLKKTNEEKQIIIRGIRDLFDNNKNNKEDKISLILSCNIENYDKKKILELTKLILDENLYNSPYLKEALIIFDKTDLEYCEVIGSLLSNPYLLKQDSYVETLNNIVKIKSKSHLKLIEEVINTIFRFKIGSISVINLLLLFNSEVLTKDVLFIANDYMNYIINLSNINYDTIILNYIKDSNSVMSKQLRRIAYSSCESVVKKKHLLYQILFEKSEITENDIMNLTILSYDKNKIEEELLDNSLIMPTANIMKFIENATESELLKSLSKIDDDTEVIDLTLKLRR